MIGYTCFGTSNLDKAVHFYTELLGLLGAKPLFQTDHGVGWGISRSKPNWDGNKLATFCFVKS